MSQQWFQGPSVGTTGPQSDSGASSRLAMRPPSNPMVLTQSVSNYPYERHYGEAKPAWPKSQLCTVTTPQQEGASRAVRGHSMHVKNTAQQPPYNQYRTFPTKGSDPLERLEEGHAASTDAREKIKRRHEDNQASNYERTLRDYQQQHNILRFRAYIHEHNAFDRNEPDHVREIIIWYYVPDGTVRMFEQTPTNSGFQQGLFLRRHAPVLDGQNRSLNLEDLRVGNEFTLYGHTFHICDADKRARETFENVVGETLAPPETVPRPSYLQEPTLTGQRYKPTKVFPDGGFEEDPVLGFYKREGDRKQQFLQHDKEILRFEAIWDDSPQAFGDIRKLNLLYHLADDTMEILEPAYNNDGRGHFHKILTRQRVPWVSADVKTKNGHLDETRNRLGLQTVDEAASDSAREHARKQMCHRYRYSKGRDNRYNYTSPITGQPRYVSNEHSSQLKEHDASMFETAREAWAPTITAGRDSDAPGQRSPFVTAGDLICGELIHIYDRPLLLTQCDQWTAQWYEQNLGVNQTKFFVDSQEKLDNIRRELSLPPHFGISAIGSEFDTRENARNFLGGRVPKFDVEQFNAYDGKILRYKARLEGDVPKAERDRSFIVNYFVSDGTISVFEDSAKNSGHSRGKFLDRGKRNIIPTERKHSAKLAQARKFGDCGYIYGYEHGFGQGYSGGQFGREDRTGPACTGVGNLRGVGINRLHPQYEEKGRPIQESDLAVGSRLCFVHNPFQELVLTQEDEFTRKYKEGRMFETEKSSHFNTLASILSGCLDSLLAVSKQRDLLERSAGYKHEEGFLSKSTMRDLMQRYGAISPIIEEHEVDNILDEEAVNDEKIEEVRPPHDVPRFRGYTDPKTGQWVCLTAREQLEQKADLLARHKGMIDYRDLVDKLRKELRRDTHTQTRHMKLLKQLRSALLSSTEHLRRVFRDLGATVTDVITPKEFRWLLRRHHLDMGISDSELRLLMSNYPSAASEGFTSPDIPPGSISWRGFVKTLIDAENRPEDEVEDFIALVSGFRNELKQGTGQAPEVFKHYRKEHTFTPAKREDGPQRAPVSRESPAEEPTGGHPGSRDESDRSRSASDQDGSARSEEKGSPRDSLSSRMDGATVSKMLSDMANFFRTRRSELVRIFRLYDQQSKGALPFRSFSNALSSCGYRLGVNEEDVFYRALENAGAIDKEGVDYRSFVESLWDDESTSSSLAL
eukprot:gb/GECG01013463.1/.p1 GENE.gb/GECG01013463.1/~~gb/GECG01013463.1/.p1  ORF type:complete len:1200 (+),score=168.95 gb/GECG01013463.1/:1-3600(+)